jgi:hypothetical protein
VDDGKRDCIVYGDCAGGTQTTNVGGISSSGKVSKYKMVGGAILTERVEVWKLLIEKISVGALCVWRNRNLS